MTTIISAEENVRRALDVFQHFESREGHVLDSRNFLAVGQNNKWNIKELQSGIKLAIDRGLIEVTDRGWLKLTKSGFDEM